VAERLNRTLIIKARALLVAAELPDGLWVEAVHTANYLRNLMPLENSISPKQQWTGRKPKIGYLRVFGCVAYIHIPSQRRQKLQRTAWKGIFVGYALTERQYRVLDLRTIAVKLYSSIKFDKSKKGGQLMPYDRQQAQAPPTELTFSDDEDDILSNIDVNPGGTLANVKENESQYPKEQQDEVEPLIVDEPHAEESDTSRSSRPTRIRRLPQRYQDGTAIALRVDCKDVKMKAPKALDTFEEAVRRKQSRE